MRRGIYTPHSHLMRDRVDLPDHPDLVHCVDTSEPLLAHELLDIPFPEYFSPDDARRRSEDDKLGAELERRREPIGCTRRGTLTYYLGG